MFSTKLLFVYQCIELINVVYNVSQGHTHIKLDVSSQVNPRPICIRIHMCRTCAGPAVIDHPAPPSPPLHEEDPGARQRRLDEVCTSREVVSFRRFSSPCLIRRPPALPARHESKNNLSQTVWPQHNTTAKRGCGTHAALTCESLDITPWALDAARSLSCSPGSQPNIAPREEARQILRIGRRHHHFVAREC